MNWYQIAKLNPKASLKKYASQNVLVKDYNYPSPLNNIMDICNYLNYKIKYKIKDVLPKDEYEEWKKKGVVLEFFAPDGNDYDKPVGTINNYVGNFPSYKIGWLVRETKISLKEIGMVISGVVSEDYKEDSLKGMIRVIRWEISCNPNFYAKKDEPPDVNFSNANASMVKSLLQIAIGSDLDGGFSEFSAQNVIEAIDQKLNTLDNINKTVQKAFPNSDDLIPDTITISERINRVKEVAEWAVKHGYSQIYFA